MLDANPFDAPSKETIATVNAFLYFVYERENIRLLKEAGVPTPWTKDPILQNYKFTNVRRRDDRVTKWIIDNVIAPNEKDPDLWFTLLICRMINWPPTLAKLIDGGHLPADPDQFEGERLVEAMERIARETSSKVFGGAYMVYPTRLSPGASKARNIVDHILSDVVLRRGEIRDVLAFSPSIRQFVAAMSQCFGISTFMAGQVAADLTYNVNQLGYARDLNTFAPIGPGSQKGLNVVNGYKLSKAWDQESFDRQLIWFKKQIDRCLEISDLSLHDVQNCFCEFFKYSDLVLNPPKARHKYVPENKF